MTFPVNGFPMRLAHGLIALLICSLAVASVEAQTAASGDALSRPANFESQRAPLVEALAALQASSGVRIAFSPDLIQDRAAPACRCQSVTVGEALTVLLAGTGLTPMPMPDQVLLVPEPEPSASVALEGVVVDADGAHGIGGARVEVRELGLAVLTDSNGRFRFQPVPAGDYHLTAQALGYRSVPDRQPTQTEGRSPVRLTLTRSPLALNEIVVAPGRFGVMEDAPLMPQSLSREEMQALPQLGEDVFRSLERLPGVATDDISAKLNVRGANSDELLIMLDGAELIEPYHMPDLDAVLGVVDVGALRGVSLLAGGLPVEHGDRMAGLLDMRTLPVIGRDTRHSIGISASNVTGRSQGTFGQGRGGWLVSVRRGFLDLVLALANQADENANDELSPRYYDVLAKVELLASPRHRVSGHVLWAGDDLGLATTEPPSKRASLHTDWSNLNVWGGWSWAMRDNLEVSTVLSGSRLTRARTGEWVSPGASEVAAFADVDDRGAFRFATLRQDWRLGLNPKALLKAGGQFRWSTADYQYFNAMGRESVTADGLIELALDTINASIAPTAREGTGYVAARVQPWSPLTLEGGARYDYRSQTGEGRVSPRLLAAFELSERTTVRASWGQHRQSHGVEELSVVDGDTTFFPSELAEQVALGVEHDFGQGIQARIEAYSRSTSDPRPRYLNVGREIIPFPEIGNDRVRFLPDEGRARGVQTILARVSERREWSVSYTLAAAEDLVDGRWTPRALDQRHTLGLRTLLKPSDDWALSVGWQFHSGWPSTPMEFAVDTLRTEGELNGILVAERPGPINSRRLPAYHRLDLRATRTWTLESGRLHAFIDVFNLYNRQNLRSYDYAVRLPSGEVVANPGETLLPLLPTFGLTWEF